MHPVTTVTGDDVQLAPVVHPVDALTDSWYFGAIRDTESTVSSRSAVAALTG